MRHQNHTFLSASAAIVAALALSPIPLAAQSADTAVPTVPAAQPSDPVVPPAASPAPTIDIPDIAAPAASGAAASEPAPEPSATVAKTTTKTTTAPAKQTTTHTTITRTVAPAAPIAAAPPPANDVAPPPAETAAAAPVAAAPSPVAKPTPVQSNNVIGTMGVVLLGLLALAILAAGMLFFRRRNPIVAQTVEEPIAAEPVTETAVAEPVSTVAPMATSAAAYRRRDLNPVAGALPSDGAAVDLPAKAPEDYEARNALFERMVNARPDKANPFTDRRQRMKRARLIMQSLGVTFDREPRIDLSQYPNNWPELRRQYHKAA